MTLFELGNLDSVSVRNTSAGAYRALFNIRHAIRHAARLVHTFSIAPQQKENTYDTDTEFSEAC